MSEPAPHVQSEVRPAPRGGKEIATPVSSLGQQLVAPRRGRMTQPDRQSLRARCYDYAWPGLYFVTVCATQRRAVFGAICDGAMVLNRWGEIVRAEWLTTATMRPGMELDAFVVMPNHFHGIVIFTHTALVGNPAGTVDKPAGTVDKPAGTVGAHCVRPAGGVALSNDAGARSAPLRRAPRSLGSVIAGFTAAVTHRIGAQVWQRNYFEHIIRDDRTLDRIREYITNNPTTWPQDRENIKCTRPDQFHAWLTGAVAR